MKNFYSYEEIAEISERLKAEGKIIVFTNGCFDILHAGHVDYLNKAKAFGDILIVGLNSDSSIRRIKGDKRPIINENERAFLLSNLKAVDYVTLFYEDTPYELIKKIVPNVLVKGGDWSIENIVGRDIVEQNGGIVKTIQFAYNQSTTNIINRIANAYLNEYS
jgi:rfaE bifunctional protein nucleotidyltransferase chain/domain